MARRCHFMSGVVLLLAVAAAASGQDPLPRKELDARLNESLRVAINLGATSFNRGEEEACCLVYESALLVAVPLLDHRPGLKKTTEEKILASRQIRSFGERAFALRAILDEIRTTIRKDAPDASLWLRLGGEPGVTAVVKDFVKTAAGNPKVNFLRDNRFKLDAPGLASLERKLVELISSAAGGPLKYSGKSMKAAHAGMAITEEEFTALAGDLLATLKKFKVPEKESTELLAIVAATKGDIVEGKPKPPVPATLWDRLGGETAVRAVVKEFVKRAAADPNVNLSRGMKFKLDAPAVAALEQKLVELISAVAGGPFKYSGKDMKTAHKDMAITDAEFTAMAGHLIDTLKKFNVADKELNELLGAVSKTREEIVEKKVLPMPPSIPPPAPAPKSLWDRLGGELGVSAVVKEVVALAAADPKVNFSRNGKFKLDAAGVAALEKKLVEFLSSQTGGPLNYTGKDMKAAHKDMGITEAEFNALAGHLVETLKKHKAPQKEIDELVTKISAMKKDVVEK